jgi:uroporphyrinogen-III decarboxylase
MAEYGIHSAWITNIWLDLISESDYRKFVMPGDRRFIELSKELGIKSHYFPCGKVPYIIECANELKPDAVHLEEFSGLDIGEIRKRVDPSILLYGNVHAIDVLLNGSVSEIEKEVKRQIDICLPQGPFIMSIGSEVALKTPCANVDALIEAAHSYK